MVNTALRAARGADEEKRNCDRERAGIGCTKELTSLQMQFGLFAERKRIDGLKDLSLTRRLKRLQRHALLRIAYQRG